MNSSFDRPVRYLALGQNPWPHAGLLQSHGCEVIESDLVPGDKLLFIDLEAFDQMIRGVLENYDPFEQDRGP